MNSVLDCSEDRPIRRTTADCCPAGRLLVGLRRYKHFAAAAAAAAQLMTMLRQSDDHRPLLGRRNAPINSHRGDLRVDHTPLSDVLIQSVS